MWWGQEHRDAEALTGMKEGRHPSRGNEIGVNRWDVEGTVSPREQCAR